MSLLRFSASLCYTVPSVLSVASGIAATTWRSDDLSHLEIAAAANRAARAGGNDGPALPRRDASRLVAGGAGRGEAGAPLPDLLCPERDGDGVLVAEGGGQRVRAVAHSRAAGAVPRPAAGALGAARELELHPRRRVGIVP